MSLGYKPQKILPEEPLMEMELVTEMQIEPLRHLINGECPSSDGVLQSPPFTRLAGVKRSGFGQVNRLAGLLQFNRPKTIFIPKTDNVE